MLITAKYHALLRNSQGLVFDSCNFASLAALREWARGRGGAYQLIVDHRDGTHSIFTVRNNRIRVAPV